MLTKIRLILFGALLSSTLVFAQPQEEPSIVLSPVDVGVGNDIFQKAYGARLLPLAISYHAGDDPAWAAPDFDDRNWEKGVDPWLPVSSLPQQGWQGIGWFRLKLRMEPPLKSQSLGFTLFHRGAIEVYLDGRLVYQSGSVGASLEEEKPRPDISPFTLPLEAGREHVLALRYSNAHFYDTAGARWQGGSGLKLYWGDLATMRHFQSATRLVEGLYVGFFIAFSLLFGLLFVLYREERLFLYSTLLYGCWALAVLIVSELTFMHITSFFIPIWAIWSVLVIGGSLALLRLLYAFFYPATPKIFYGFLIAGSITTFVAAVRFDNISLISLYFIPLFLEVLRIVVVALWRKKRWAWIVGLGFLPIIVLGTIDMLNELGSLVAPWAGTPFEPGLVIIFFMSASLAIYVGMRFADANRSLAQANSDLVEANRDLDEINRTLEERVEERTTELRASQAQLIQSEKMASLGQLTAGIAHEIKNPLNFVNNFASLSIDLADELVDELAASPEKTVAEIRDELGDILTDLKHNAIKINEHGKRADGIVMNMLDHARSTPERHSLTDVHALLDQYINLAFRAVNVQREDFRCDIQKDYDEKIDLLEVAPQEIGRVILNLLKNAFEAIYERASEESGEYNPTIQISTRDCDGEVEIRVSDNGVGIPRQAQDKIFEPFFTTKPAGEGTGLGLSLSYDIVTQGHGGTLTVESEEGRGSTFIVALPVNSTKTRT